MALTFVSASSHVINTAIGACTYTGPNSAAAIVKRAADGVQPSLATGGHGSRGFLVGMQSPPETS